MNPYILVGAAIGAIIGALIPAKAEASEATETDDSIRSPDPVEPAGVEGEKLAEVEAAKIDDSIDDDETPTDEK